MVTEKLRAILLPAVFIGFLAVLLALFLLTPDKSYSETEKRYLTTAPEMSAAAVMSGTWQSGLEDYIADQFPGRNLWMGIHAYDNLIWGRNAAQEIYRCKDGYLINAPEAVNMALFETNISRLDQFAAQTGVPATLIPIPQAGYVMENVLPFGHGEYTDGALMEQAVQDLQNVWLLDVSEVLKEALCGGAVYYRTDHHLTSWGNYLVYRAYCQLQGMVAAPAEAYTVRSYDGFYGTTWSGSGYWLTAGDTVELWDSGTPVTVTISDSGSEPKTSDSVFFPEHLKDLDKYPVFLDGNHGLVTIENPAAEHGTLLVIRDSFAHCLSGFLAENYRTVYLVDLRYYRGSLSQFVTDHGVEELLYVYGMDSLLTDTNSAWLY